MSINWKPNKYNSKCETCGVALMSGSGVLYWQSDPGYIPKKRGRPTGGRFRVFCLPHAQAHEAAKENQDLNKANEEVVKEEVQQEAEEEAGDIPKDVQNVSNMNLEEIRKIALEVANSQDVKLLKSFAEMVDQMVNQKMSTVPVTKVEIKINDKVEVKDTGPQHYVFKDVLMFATQREHVYLVGPAGSGKTTIAEQVAKALSLKFYFTGALDSKYGLIGFRDAHGTYHRTPFREAFECGGVFLFDEIDASSANALLCFNAALANGHMDFPDGIVARHPDFVCIAAANTWGSGQDRVYVGRNQLDAASLDRFSTVEMDYDTNLENMISPDASWTKFVQQVRAATRKLQMRYVVSPRASIKGGKMLKAGMDRNKVETMTLFKSMKPEDVAKIRQEIRFNS